MKKAVLSVSGGLDSTSLMVHLLREGYEVKAYSFDYGQRHLVELDRLSQNILYLKGLGLPIEWDLLDVKSIFSDSNSSLLPQSGNEIPEGHYADENMKSTVVENRNAIFASILYGKALAWANKTNEEVVISLGLHQGDHQIYPDCRPESRDALSLAFRLSNWNSERVDYYTPYIKIDKGDVLKDGLVSCNLLGLDFNLIFRNTNTCYNPTQEGLSCGKCGSCTERLEAFEKVSRVDPVEYSNIKH